MDYFQSLSTLAAVLVSVVERASMVLVVLVSAVSVV